MGAGDAHWRRPGLGVVMDTCECENNLIKGGIVTDSGVLIAGDPKSWGMKSIAGWAA